MRQQADSRDVPGTSIHSGHRSMQHSQQPICSAAVVQQSPCPVRLRRRLQTVQATAPLAGRAADVMVPAAALPGARCRQGGGGASLGGCRAVVLPADRAVRHTRGLRGQVRGQEVCPAHELDQLHVFLHSTTRPCLKRKPGTAVTPETAYLGSHLAGPFASVVSAVLLSKDP